MTCNEKSDEESHDLYASSDEDEIPTLLNLNEISSPHNQEWNPNSHDKHEEKGQNGQNDKKDDIENHPEERTKSNKVPVTILTGFLGSGKTTLIQYILNSPDHHYKIAIIENEYAGMEAGNENSSNEQNSLAIESLIARDGTSSSFANNKKNSNGKTDNLISLTELPNGCVCCSVKDSLVSTLESLIQYKSNNYLDYIIIEASGMANPGPIASIFWMDDQLDSRLRLDGIVTLVDAKHIPMQLRETGRRHSNNNDDNNNNHTNWDSGFEAERQIAYADRILVNKVDLLSTQNDLDMILGLISSINPTAPIKTTRFSKVPDLRWILNADCFNATRVQNEFLSDEESFNHRTITTTTSSAWTSPATLNGHNIPCVCLQCSPFAINNSSFHTIKTNEPSYHSQTSTPFQKIHPPRSSSHSHTSSVQTITLVYPNQSVNLKRMHTWLATILWPDQDKSDEELRWIIDGHKKNTTITTKLEPKGNQKQVMEIFRMKGILSVCHYDDENRNSSDGSNLKQFQTENTIDHENEWQFINQENGLDRRRYIVQVVHDLWEIHAGSNNLCWDGAHAEEQGCKLVIIGQWLDRNAVIAGFENCFVSYFHT